MLVKGPLLWWDDHWVVLTGMVRICNHCKHLPTNSAVYLHYMIIVHVFGAFMSNKLFRVRVRDYKVRLISFLFFLPVNGFVLHFSSRWRHPKWPTRFHGFFTDLLVLSSYLDKCKPVWPSRYVLHNYSWYFSKCDPQIHNRFRRYNDKCCATIQPWLQCTQLSMKYFFKGQFHSIFDIQFVSYGDS